MENGTYEEIVSHLDRELGLNGLEAPDELQMNFVMHQATQQNQKIPNQLDTFAKSQVIIEVGAVNSNERKTKPKITRIVLIITMVVVRQTLSPIVKFPTIPTQTRQIIRETENLDLSTHPVRPVVELNTLQRNVILEQTQRTARLARINDQKGKTKPNREMLKANQMVMSKLQPKL